MRAILLIIINVLAFCTFSNPSKTIENSPFEWIVRVDGKAYEGIEINKIRNGFKINSNEVSCKLKFSSKWNSASKKPHSSVYEEKIWLICKVGNIAINLSPVLCEKKNTSNFDSDLYTIVIGKSSITIMCSFYDKN